MTGPRASLGVKLATEPFEFDQIYALNHKTFDQAAVLRRSIPRNLLDDHVPKDRPVVFVSNHTSYLDSIVLMAAMSSPYRFVVAGGYAAWPIVGTAIRKARYITVDRRSAMTRAGSFDVIEAALRNGSSVLIYPERRRARGPALERFRAGAFRAAAATGREVVPISVRGTRVIMRRGVRLLRRGRIDVTIHQPIAPAGSDRREIARLREAVRSAIERDVGGVR